jgi:addiction module RelB/DinJ family antitoxin
MPETALVQTRIDPAAKERAVAVLDNMGLTVSDAVRILLTRIANEGRYCFPSRPTRPRTTLGSGRRCSKPCRIPVRLLRM